MPQAGMVRAVGPAAKFSQCQRRACRERPALAPPPANFRDASGVQKRTARSGTLRVLLRVERAEYLGGGNE